MRKILLIMFMMGVCLSLAQEKRTEESSAIIADTVINNGWVVAYGELLKRPYTVAMKNDTIFVNNIPVSPPLPIPAPPSIKSLKETELGKKFFNAQMPFQTRCGELYAEWYNKYGEEKAEEMITTLLDTQQVVSIKKYKLSDGNLEIIYGYKWSDLYEEITPVLQNTYFNITLNLNSWISVSREKKTEEEIKLRLKQYKQQQIELIIKELNLGSLLIFDFHHKCLIPSDKAENVINDVREVLHAALSDSVKIKKIGELLMLIPESAAEVIKNSDFWEVENEK